MPSGSLPKSVARSLSHEQIEPDYAPDGLTEADIDALAAQIGLSLEPAPDDERAEIETATVVPLHLAVQPPSDQTSEEVA
jgi:hypothetical protein